MKQVKILLQNVNTEILESSIQRCIEWFCAYPIKKIGLNQLSIMIKSSKTSTKQAVEYLIKNNFLNREIVGKAWLLYANQSHKNFLIKKIPSNIGLIYGSNILDVVKDLIPGNRSITLFGSYRYGTDLEQSDIDIAVEVIGNKPLEVKKIGLMDHFGYRKNVPVNLHIFSRNKIDTNLFSNIANGLVLDGFLEVKI